MLNLEQEQRVKDKIDKAKELLLEAMYIVKTDWSVTLEGKAVNSPDGSAWLELIGEISDRVRDLEHALEHELLLAGKFEERLDDNKEEHNDAR